MTYKIKENSIKVKYIEYSRSLPFEETRQIRKEHLVPIDTLSNVAYKRKVYHVQPPNMYDKS